MVFGGLNRGGSETAIMNVYRNIDRATIQFDFVSHSKNHTQYNYEIESMGGKVYFFPKYKLYNHFSYLSFWNRFISNHKEYRVIHIHYYSIAGIIIKTLNKRSIKTIIHSHTANVNGLRGFLIKLINIKIAKYSNFLLACSKKAGKWLFGSKIIENKNFYVVNNGIDINRFLFDLNTRNKIRKKLKIEDKIVICHVGRFSREKNHFFLLNLFAHLLQKYNNLTLILVGDGEYKNNIYKQIDKLNLSPFVRHFSNYEDVSTLLNASDLFLFPSLYEGFGIAAIESQISGLFTLTSSAIPEEVFITHKIVKVGKPVNKFIGEWSAIITSILESGQYHNRIVDKRLVENMDIFKTTEWYTNFYNKIL